MAEAAEITVKYFHPGDVIYINEPFAAVIYFEYRREYCDSCFKRDCSVKACTLCRHVFYCSKNCQQLAWPDHKLECSHLKDMNIFGADPSYVRLAGKVILKLKTEAGKKFEDIVGEGKLAITRTFDHLVSHKEEKRKEPEAMSRAFNLAKNIKLFIGAENMPSDEEVHEIIWKLDNNKFGVGNRSHSFASALYIGAAIFDHACIPNAIRKSDGRNIVFRAVQDIACTDMRGITISYFPVVDINEDSEFVFKSFYSKCYCKDCSTPYGDSALTKILNKEKAFIVVEESKQIWQHIKKTKTGTPAEVKKINDCLKRQEGVLGKTNIYRLRLLASRLHFGFQNRTTEISYGTELLDGLKEAFGEYSEELVWVYEFLELLYKERRQHQAALRCKAMYLKLYKLHGTKPEEDEDMSTFAEEYAYIENIAKMLHIG